MDLLRFSKIWAQNKCPRPTVGADGAMGSEKHPAFAQKHSLLLSPLDQGL